MRVRVARHTDDLERIVAFYRDRVGLPEIGRFTGHDGYDGVFLDIPGTGAHLEFTTGGDHPAAAPHPEDLLVLYLDDDAQIAAIAGRIGDAPVVPANPYWRAHATTFADPDGHQLVLVGVRVERYEGDREALRPLFELAEDSPAQLDSYIGAGRVLVATTAGEIVGHVQLVEAGPSAYEVKNVAVRTSHQGRVNDAAKVREAVSLARPWPPWWTARWSCCCSSCCGCTTGRWRWWRRSLFRCW